MRTYTLCLYRSYLATRAMIRVLDRRNVVVIPPGADAAAYMDSNKAAVYAAFVGGLRDALRTGASSVVTVVHRGRAVGVSRPVFRPMLESAIAHFTCLERYEDAAEARDLLARL